MAVVHVGVIERMYQKVLVCGSIAVFLVTGRRSTSRPVSCCDLMARAESNKISVTHFVWALPPFSFFYCGTHLEDPL